MIKTVDSIANNAARYLQEKILMGAWAADSMLPGQRELAQEMGISRASLREAISMLEALGMLRAYPGKGVKVTHGLARRAADLPSGPEAIPAEDVFLFRFVLEPAAAAMAAGAINAAGAKALWDLQHALENAIESLDLLAASESDLAFHLEVAVLSGNEMFRQSIVESRSRVAHNLRLAFADLHRIQETALEHRKITAAICSNNQEAAHHAMRTHLLQTAQRAGIQALSLYRPSSVQETSYETS